jgi:hypothetical protein
VILNHFGQTRLILKEKPTNGALPDALWLF